MSRMLLRGLGGTYSSRFPKRRRGEYRLVIELNGGGGRVDSLRLDSRRGEGIRGGASGWGGGSL